MCRSMTENGDLPCYRRDRDRDRDRDQDRDRLNIKAFHLRLYVGSGSGGSRRLPETLTLLYLPRIGGGPLEINGSKIRPDAPAFVALQRTRTAEAAGGAEAAFASTDRVRATAGVRFETYVGAERVLAGALRRAVTGGWRVECQRAEVERVGATGAEVLVAGERGEVVRERVDLKRTTRRKFCLKLEEIPEGESEGRDCCCRRLDGSEGDEQWEVVEMDGGDVVETEGVGWAVDVALWVMCLGVGFLVSRASHKGWRKRFF